jgi:hypothetical protein
LLFAGDPRVTHLAVADDDAVQHCVAVTVGGVEGCLAK